jgi:hypothetical protein
LQTTKPQPFEIVFAASATATSNTEDNVFGRKEMPCHSGTIRQQQDLPIPFDLAHRFLALIKMCDKNAKICLERCVLTNKEAQIIIKIKSLVHQPADIATRGSLTTRNESTTGLNQTTRTRSEIMPIKDNFFQ